MLEICVDNVRAAVTAYQAGAQRLELCAALDIGGVTPCSALVQAVRSHVSCPLIVLIRPRGGNFVYDEWEVEQALASMSEAISCGAEGVAVGGLTQSRELDLALLQAIARHNAEKVQLVMHRAFDLVFNPAEALEQLVTLGFDRVLTSGGPAGDAPQNTLALKSLNMQASGRIAIMPGGGVRADNVHFVLEGTGCCEVHGSFRSPDRDSSESRSFGSFINVDARAVSRARQIVDQIVGQRSGS